MTETAYTASQFDVVLEPKQLLPSSVFAVWKNLDLLVLTEVSKQTEERMAEITDSRHSLAVRYQELHYFDSLGGSKVMAVK